MIVALIFYELWHNLYIKYVKVGYCISMVTSKWHYGISKPELMAKKHISRIAGTVFIADSFFLAAFLEICKLAN